MCTFNSNSYDEINENSNYLYRIEKSMRETKSMMAAREYIKSVSISDVIRTLSIKQAETINRVTKGMSSVIDRIFEELTKDNKEINKPLLDTLLSVRPGFQTVSAYLQISYDYSIARNTKMGRTQERHTKIISFIEQGFKYYSIALKNASIENYDIAQRQFNLAVQKEDFNEIEDFVSLYYIGKIYQTKNYADVAKAESFFRKSVIECISEAEGNSAIFSTSNIGFGANYWSFARNIYIDLAAVCFVQKKMADAVSFAEKACAISPDNLNARFALAKYHTLNANTSVAVSILKDLVKINPVFFDLTIATPELIANEILMEFLNSLLNELRCFVHEAIGLCHKYIEGIADKTCAAEYLNLIEDAASDGTNYLKLLEAKTKLTCEREWKIKSGAVIYGNDMPTCIGDSFFNGTVLDFLPYERRSILAIPIVLNHNEIEDLVKTKEKLIKSVDSLNYKKEETLKLASNGDFSFFPAVLIVCLLSLILFIGNLDSIIFGCFFGFFLFFSLVMLLVLIFGKIEIEKEVPKIESLIDLKNKQINKIREKNARLNKENTELFASLNL